MSTIWKCPLIKKKQELRTHNDKVPRNHDNEQQHKGDHVDFLCDETQAKMDQHKALAVFFMTSKYSICLSCMRRPNFQTLGHVWQFWLFTFPICYTSIDNDCSFWRKVHFGKCISHKKRDAKYYLENGQSVVSFYLNKIFKVLLNFEEYKSHVLYIWEHYS